MNVVTYNLTVKPVIFKSLIDFLKDNNFEKIHFIDYVDKRKEYEKDFQLKNHEFFYSHNDFLNLKNLKKNKKFYDVDFIKKNIFYEKLLFNILSRYELNQNTFSFTQRQDYIRKAINCFSNFLIDNSITHIIFYDYPHHFDSFVLYILGKYLKKKIIIISYLFLLGNYRLVIDKNIENRFSNFVNQVNMSNNVNNYNLNKKINNYIYENKHIKPHYIKEEKSIFYYLLKDLYRSWYRGIFKESNYFIKTKINSNFEDHNFPNEIYSVFLNFKNRLKIKRLEKKYIKVSLKNIDLDKKFILFLPSVQPEASSLPLANYYHDFNIIINMLLKNLPDNWLIYYKEHPLTFNLLKESFIFKNEKYYDEISNNKIKFIHHNEDTYKYIKNSQAVATSTGSAGLEATLKGKPVLNFGTAWWSNYKNIFHISNNNDLKKVIFNLINNKIKISEAEVKEDIFKTFKFSEEFICFNKEKVSEVEKEIEDDKEKFLNLQKFILETLKNNL